MLGEQLAIYDRHNISWSIWLYKDIGMQGMLHTSPTSAWNTRIRPFLDKKKAYRLDAWGVHPSTEAEAALRPLLEWIEKICPGAGERKYPTNWGTERHVLRAVVQTWLSERFSDEFAELFRGCDEHQLEELAQSFAFDQCVQRDGLETMLRAHATGRGRNGVVPH